MPCNAFQGLTPVAFFNLPPYNNGLPIPLFDLKPPQDGQLSINTLEGWNALVARTKKKAASDDCNIGSGGDQPEGQSKNHSNSAPPKEKSQEKSQLSRWRLERQLTRMAVAGAVGVSEGTYERWENGLTSPTDRQLFELARVLNCTANQLDSSKDRDKPFRRFRLRAGMTRKQAAFKIGVDEMALSPWERGLGLPCEKNLYRTAEVYGCTAKELLGDQWEPPHRTVEDRNRFYTEHQGLIWWVMNKHKSVLRAVNADYDDVFQELSICMLKALEKQDPQKGSTIPYLLTNLKFELLHYASHLRAGGISGLKRDEWRNYPVLSSLEALQEAGVQI